MMSSPEDISRKAPLSGRKLRERAYDLLSRRDHSETELRRKLRQKGGLAEEIPPLIEDLREKGYLDDRRFCENFVRFRVGKAWGLRRYRQELLARGVTSDVVDSVLSGLPELDDESVQKKLHRLAEKELGRGREPEKVVASLIRRGFRATAVRSVVRECRRRESEF